MSVIRYISFLLLALGIIYAAMFFMTREQNEIMKKENERINRENEMIVRKNERVNRESERIVREKIRLKLKLMLDECNAKINALEDKQDDSLQILLTLLQIQENKILQSKPADLGKIAGMRESISNEKIKEKMLSYLIFAAYSSKQKKILNLLSSEDQAIADGMTDGLWRKCLFCNGSGRRQCRVCEGSGVCQLCKGTGQRKSFVFNRQRRRSYNRNTRQLFEKTRDSSRYESGSGFYHDPDYRDNTPRTHIAIICPTSCTHCDHGSVKCTNCFGQGKFIKSEQANSRRVKAYQQLVKMLQDEMAASVITPQAIKSKKAALIQQRDLIRQKLNAVNAGKHVDLNDLTVPEDPEEKEMDVEEDLDEENENSDREDENEDEDEEEDGEEA